MGVFDKAKSASHPGEQDGKPYICTNCDTYFEVQYHACPNCDGYDVRRAKWIE